jgi:putative methionine-R-sulfoxide reductase with GAF domain
VKLETKLTRAKELQDDTLKKYNLETEYLQSQLHEKEESLHNTKKELLTLSARFDELAEKSSAAVTQWKGMYRQEQIELRHTLLFLT